ncbi:molecular chaperone [Paenibacillus glacialis]|uniref:Molecular chaperone n=1 Tax=Paenibacillus glacialis TaxID=494026 RepID=A0A168N7U5_9BACL|nr:molecular chaperone [Paenibacillus glacialis]OAB45495.1 molecular chaperone [Paenibacillus glacialis]
MKGYSYKLHNDLTTQSSGRGAAKYTRDELMEMTTFQLRNICYKQRLVEGLGNNLDREGLIRIIMKYLSAEERLFIGPICEDGFDRVQSTIRKYMKIPLQGDGGIRVPARLILYSGMAMDKSDGYRVTSTAPLTESNVLLVNDRMELCGILNLQQDDGKQGQYYLSTDRETQWMLTSNRHYSLLFLRKRESEYIYNTYYQVHDQPPANIQYYKIPLAELEIRELEETDAVLAIDFGTSNTTAGAFLYNGYAASPSSLDLLNGQIQMDTINYVKFPDTTYKNTEWIEALPSVVSVTDCADPTNIHYNFGYQALRSMRHSSYSSRASVFHGMKRWVNNYTKLEEVMDTQGNIAMVSRSDILRAYIRYVVTRAEHQFKCKFRHLHLSSPVKMKTQFIDMFTQILPDYKIEEDNALDEGMAVLYNTIADGIERGVFEDGEEYKALVIDCGGGTTDLSSCNFRVEDGHMSYRIDINTTYENGDTNFGGNNITYRIMQFMKIVFADYYMGQRNLSDIDTLIDIPGNDLFREVDEQGVEQIYSELERRYREAEHVIPTAFTLYENRSRDEYLRVRGNFHFLWEIAEQMKEQFFRRTGILRNRFHSENDPLEQSDLQITTMDRWFLSVSRNGEMKDEYEFPDVVFNIKEITQLIKADIYDVVRKFLDDFYREGRISDYSIIKLTGQSCRIDVFREALKEFVPGRSIEFKQKPVEGRVPDLKLSCVRGAIRYLNARKFGSIEVNISNYSAVIPYTVSAHTHNNQEKELISSLERSNRVLGSISRPFDTAEIEFFLHGNDGGLRQSYLYVNKVKDYRPVTHEEVDKTYPDKIPQDDTDSIVNGETKWFVFADDNHWGFHVLPIARRKDGLHLGRKQIFAFESDLSELDFFDGLK